MEETNYSKLEPFSLEGVNSPVKGFLINRYKSLAAAYNSGSLSSLKEWVEPNLYSRMLEDFTALSEKNMRFEFEVEDLDVSFFNQCVFIGVNIKRSENLESSKYLDIISGKDIYKDNHDLNEADKEFMKNTIFFFHPEAPCNVITGISMRIANPVKLIQNNKILSSSTSHLLQFECELLKTRIQRESFTSGEFQNMLKLLTTEDPSLIREDWHLTDIDESLSGNPHTT